MTGNNQIWEWFLTYASLKTILSRTILRAKVHILQDRSMPLHIFLIGTCYNMHSTRKYVKYRREQGFIFAEAPEFQMYLAKAMGTHPGMLGHSYSHVHLNAHIDVYDAQLLSRPALSPSEREAYRRYNDFMPITALGHVHTTIGPERRSKYDVVDEICKQHANKIESDAAIGLGALFG